MTIIKYFSELEEKQKITKRVIYVTFRTTKSRKLQKNYN